MDDKKTNYIKEMQKLYKENSSFIFILLGCILTEKTFKKALCGEDKRTILKKTINEIIDTDDKVDDEIINSVIDFTFYIVNNKKLLNAFKKSCKCVK